MVLTNAEKQKRHREKMKPYIKRARALVEGDPFSGWHVYVRNLRAVMSRMETRLDVLRNYVDSIENEFKGD